MMSTSFLNMGGDDDEQLNSNLGASLKRKIRTPRPRADADAVVDAAKANGFNRKTESEDDGNTQIRRGRPPLNDDMTYWRIYVSRELRNRLNAVRDAEGRRLSDVIEDMLECYEVQTDVE